MIKTIFEVDGAQSKVYSEAVASSLRMIFPDPFLIEESEKDDFQERFEERLPLFRWIWRDGYLSLHFIAKHRLNIGKFFYEMIHRWLLPGKRLDVACFFSSEFRFSTKRQYYTLAEMAIRMESGIDRGHIEHNLRVIETEIRLGMVSIYHATRLLETHLVSAQEKNGILQEKISRLIQRNPEEIDYDIFGELQHFIVMSKEEFKMRRDPHHLSRMVALFYLYRKSIAKAQEKQPDKRHVRLKLSTVQIDVPWGKKTVLAVCVGLNFLRANELFDEKHLMRAIQNGISGVRITPDSCFANEGIDDTIHTLYLEVEKETGEEFSFEEIDRLKKFLPEEIKRSVEIPLKNLFMPRNEEEIIRYIVSLSGQLRYVKDLPQAILIFDEQKDGDLYFTVIIVRIVFPESVSIQTAFTKEESFLTYIPDRVKRIGMLRKKHPKEATVFRVKFASLPFLRDDHSVDLFRARRALVQEVQRVVGEVRDYNGGMIAKQVELLEAVQNLLGEASREGVRLLESFFHTLYPIESRSVVPPHQLKKLFLLWKKVLDDPSVKVAKEVDETAAYVIGRTGYIDELDPSQFLEMQLITVRPEHEEKFLGYLFFSQSQQEKHDFLDSKSVTL